VPAKAADVQGQEVEAAIKKGVDYLLAHEKASNFETMDPKTGPAAGWASMQGAETALVLYALLHVGEGNGEPRLRSDSKELAPVVTWLSGVTPKSTYCAALQSCALALVKIKDTDNRSKDPAYVALVRAVDFLLTNGNKDGGYNYGPLKTQPTKTWWDSSNGQYALLGIWAASEARLEIPSNFWKLEDTWWRFHQMKDGSWSYSDFKPGWPLKASVTMTVAGVASLYITQEFLDTDTGTEMHADPQMTAGLAKLEEEFNPSTNNLYYLYGIERVGLASGRKFIKKSNWYKEVAANLIKWQKPDGSWESTYAGNVPTNAHVAYALLFLARGRNPVVFNKLQYNGPWNARPRDDANLTAYLSKKYEHALNWQVVDLQSNPEEWQDAPILLITGSHDPKFTPEDIAKIKRFIDAGGMVFSTSDGSSEEFTAAIRKSAAAVVDNKYEMRELPRDHVIYSQAMAVKVANPPRMLAMSNGVREVWVHSPVDMGAAWHRHAYASEAMFQVPTNIYFYATGKASPRNKLQSLVVNTTGAKASKTLGLARISYGGNWDPEPGAWPRMAKLALRDFGTDVPITAVKPAELDPKKTPLAVMTGTARFTLSPDEIQQLKTYLDNGGTLLADATGGSPGFTESFLDLVKNLSTQATLEHIPATDPLYHDLQDHSSDHSGQLVQYRKAWLMANGMAREGKLLGLKKDGRWSVIFSAEDLTHGLLGTNTWGVLGYAPDTAQEIARGIIESLRK